MTLFIVTFFDELVVTEDDNTDVVGLQVEGHALKAGAEFHHLLGLDVLQAIHTGNTWVGKTIRKGPGKFKFGLNESLSYLGC